MSAAQTSVARLLVQPVIDELSPRFHCEADLPPSAVTGWSAPPAAVCASNCGRCSASCSTGGDSVQSVATSAHALLPPPPFRTGTGYTACDAVAPEPPQPIRVDDSAAGFDVDPTFADGKLRLNATPSLQASFGELGDRSGGDGFGRSASSEQLFSALDSDWDVPGMSDFLLPDELQTVDLSQFLSRWLPGETLPQLVAALADEWIFHWHGLCDVTIVTLLAPYVGQENAVAIHSTAVNMARAEFTPESFGLQPAPAAHSLGPASSSAYSNPTQLSSSAGISISGSISSSSGASFRDSFSNLPDLSASTEWLPPSAAAAAAAAAAVSSLSPSSSPDGFGPSGSRDDVSSSASAASGSPRRDGRRPGAAAAGAASSSSAFATGLRAARTALTGPVASAAAALPPPPLESYTVVGENDKFQVMLRTELYQHKTLYYSGSPQDPTTEFFDFRLVFKKPGTVSLYTRRLGAAENVRPYVQLRREDLAKHVMSEGQERKQTGRPKGDSGFRPKIEFKTARAGAVDSYNDMTGDLHVSPRESSGYFKLKVKPAEKEERLAGEREPKREKQVFVFQWTDDRSCCVELEPMCCYIKPGGKDTKVQPASAPHSRLPTPRTVAGVGSEPARKRPRGGTARGIAVASSSAQFAEAAVLGAQFFSIEPSSLHIRACVSRGSYRPLCVIKGQSIPQSVGVTFSTELVAAQADVVNGPLEGGSMLTVVVPCWPHPEAVDVRGSVDESTPVSGTLRFTYAA